MVIPSHFRAALIGLLLAGTAVPATTEAGLFKRKEKRKKEAMEAVSAPDLRPPATPVPRPQTTSALAEPLPSVTGTLGKIPRSRPGQLRVFILGDSQSLFRFGTTLQRGLVENDCEVLYHAVKNGTPYFWQGGWASPVLTRIYEPAHDPAECGQFREVSMNPQSVAGYVDAFDPDVFVFQAGTNFEKDLATENPLNIGKLIAESVVQAGSRGAKVLWIGQPDARDDAALPETQELAYRTLREVLEECSARQGGDCLFDSREVCPYPNDAAGDGEHPPEEAGQLWGMAATAWILESIDRWRGNGTLRPAPQPEESGPESAPMVIPLPVIAEEDPTPQQTIGIDARLVAKSDPGDLRTLSYTDAFSIFQYRLEGTAGRAELEALGAVPDADGSLPVHVLHWTAHNDGKGPRGTVVSEREPGLVYHLELSPLAGHALEKALATMPRNDDFGDLLAPVFLSRSFAEEREGAAQGFSPR